MSNITSYREAVAVARRSGERYVEVERGDTTATVRLTDPEKLNALSGPLTIQLHDALRELDADHGLRTIVLTGADPAFSAGGDLRLMRDVAHSIADTGPDGATGIWRWIRREFGGICKLITRSDKAFIAAVNGSAAGVGLSFALACDMFIASEHARLVPAFGRIGLLPEVGQSWLLTRRLGYQRTFDLFTSGRTLTGSDAVELGLANDVVAHGDLLTAAAEKCEQIAALPDHVPVMLKPLLRQAADMSWEQAISMEEFAEPATFTTRAHRRAVHAMLNHDS